MENKPQMQWDMIDDSEFQLIIFSRREYTFNLKFLEFLGLETKTFKTGNKKEFSWKVEDLDSGKIMKLPVISNRLLREMKKHNPIIGKSFTITKIFERDEFDNYYEVIPYTIQKELKTTKK